MQQRKNAFYYFHCLSYNRFVEITEIKVFLVHEEKLKAYVTIVFDDCFVVRDLKVINGSSGLFVAMPAKKTKDGTFRDIVHPLNQSARIALEQKVFDAYFTEFRSVKESTIDDTLK